MRTIMILLGLALAVLVPTSAGAQVPLSVYVRARAAAPDVVVMKITRIIIPSGDFGTCTAQGQVVRVERGNRYTAGQPIDVNVPCRQPMITPPTSSRLLFRPIEQLRSRPYGRAYLEENGALAMSQFELLPSAD